jgi:Kef-type K+ transport system membrane component KefB
LTLPALLASVTPAGATPSHADPVAPLLLALAVILIGAKLGGELATRLGQPAVLGELAVGVLLGNLHFIGVDGFEHYKTDAMVDMIARLGVIILLFEVGLESTVAQMMAVGPSSLLVATIGVALPFALGWGVGAWLLPEAGPYVHAFLGATLTATSVGITARVLQDLGKTNTPESRIILGAAVLDDVMGLVILAVVGGAIAAAASGQALSYGSVAVILAKAVLFLVGALVIGVRLSPLLFRRASRLQARGVLLALALTWCFLLSWLASVIDLAPIVGAFAAGLVLESVHYRGFVDKGEHGLEELVAPIAGFLVPVFFVVMGMRTDLASFTDTRVLGLAAALTVAAVIGKQACGLGVIGGGVDRLTVGLGMIPRGEVGLIFASMGMALVLAGTPIITPPLYSAIVVMVIVTTLVTPPALKWSLGRVAARSGARSRSAKAP